MAAHLGTYTVSARGQLSLPADARRRWGLADGGPVEIVDLGDAALLVPGGFGTLRRHLADIVDADTYKLLVDAIDDPGLQTE
jgi:AbrB family looped-hinge helix DNA binding protein